MHITCTHNLHDALFAVSESESAYGTKDCLCLCLKIRNVHGKLIYTNVS